MPARKSLPLPSLLGDERKRVTTHTLSPTTRLKGRSRPDLGTTGRDCPSRANSMTKQQAECVVHTHVIVLVRALAQIQAVRSGPQQVA